MKKRIAKQYLWLLGAPLGAIGLPLFTISLYHLLLFYFRDSDYVKKWILLEPFEGVPEILYVSVIAFQAPAGFILGFCTGSVVNLVKSRLFAEVRQVGVCGGILVGAPFAYLLYLNNRGTEKLLAMMPLFAPPLLWAFLLAFVSWRYRPTFAKCERI